MAYHDTEHQHHFDGLHPAIYKALAGLALWLVIAAWVFFGTQGYYASFAVAVVTGFFLVAAAIPYVLWRVWRNASPEGQAERTAERTRPGGAKPTFPEWWHGQIETWQSTVEGWDAAVEVLMPLGVAALGMTLIGLVFRLTAGG
jgi:hypothetical protein